MANESTETLGDPVAALSAWGKNGLGPHRGGAYACASGCQAPVTGRKRCVRAVRGISLAVRLFGPETEARGKNREGGLTGQHLGQVRPAPRRVRVLGWIAGPPCRWVSRPPTSFGRRVPSRANECEALRFQSPYQRGCTFDGGIATPEQATWSMALPAPRPIACSECLPFIRVGHQAARSLPKTVDG
jgi:hypothetical protein